jgi:hypothetical protein
MNYHGLQLTYTVETSDDGRYTYVESWEIEGVGDPHELADYLRDEDRDEPEIADALSGRVHPSTARWLEGWRKDDVEEACEAHHRAACEYARDDAAGI